MKIFWCYFEEGVLFFLHERAGANLRIYKTTRIYMKELNDRSNYMPNYWYNMKNYTGTLHGIYRLYYKLLHVHGESKIKSHYHELVHGPCTTEFNTALLQHLIDTILEKICAKNHMVSTKYMCLLKLQDQMTMVGVHANKAIESFLNFDDHFFGDFKCGKPVQLNWL